MTISLGGRVDEALRFAGLGHVRAGRDGVGLQPDELPHEPVRRSLTAQKVHTYVHTGAGELDTDRTTDPPGASRDDCGSPPEIHGAGVRWVAKNLRASLTKQSIQKGRLTWAGGTSCRPSPSP